MMLLEKNTKRYAGRPVGNSPELMPLDYSLFQDLHMFVKIHVAATFHLPSNHADKFSYSTPKTIESAYRQCWTIVPSSERIIQDVDKMIFAMGKIKDAKGDIVKGLANRSGHREYSEKHVKDNNVKGKSSKDKVTAKKPLDNDDDQCFSFDKRCLHDDAKKHLREQKAQLVTFLNQMKNSVPQTRKQVEDKAKLDKRRAELAKKATI